jgi:hypothetical protein
MKREKNPYYLMNDIPLGTITEIISPETRKELLGSVEDSELLNGSISENLSQVMILMKVLAARKS